MRTFGVTARATIGGTDESRGPLHGDDTQPLPLPSGSILSAGPSLERGYLAQAVLDIFAALFLFGLLALILFAFGLAVYVPFFFRV